MISSANEAESVEGERNSLQVVVMKGKIPGNIDEYIADCPLQLHEKLKELRVIIKKAAPVAEEKISYHMPAFYLNGPLVFFAVQKNHIGFYPTPSGVEAFREDLTGYKTSKGAIRFPNDKPLPLQLVSRIVRFRVKENTRASRSK
jgi:uncharacterized protein YdhG (YjbR/CyaY superfamily)